MPSRCSALAVLALLALAAPGLAVAQDDTVYRITIGPGDADFPLAVAEPFARNVPTSATASFDATLRRALQVPGYFKLIDRAAQIDRSNGVRPGTWKLADWSPLGATAIVKTELGVDDGLPMAEVWIYDGNTGDKVAAFRLLAPPTTDPSGLGRVLGLRAADAVLGALTGAGGLLTTPVLAVQERQGPTGRPTKRLMLLDVDGNGQRRLTRNSTLNLSPAWSPDGGQVAWTSYRRGDPDVFVKDLGTGRTRLLTAKPGVEVGPAWSPDGQTLAVSRTVGGDADIVLLDATTGAELKRITEGGGIDVGPAFSPDGTKLAFSSERSGGSQIFVHDLTTGSTRRVSREGSFNTDPTWSPDGTKLAYVGRDPSFDVFVLDLERGKSIRLTERQGSNEDPAWSPDGRWLVFSSTRTGRSEIWLTTADGRHQVSLTPGSGGWSQPSFRPVME